MSLIFNDIGSFFYFFEEIMIEKLKEISKNMKNKWLRSSRKTTGLRGIP